MQESKRSKLGSILFYWLTSFLVVIALVALILKFMGMPVGATFLSVGNHIPGLNQLLPEPAPVYAQADEASDAADWKAEYEKSEAIIQEKNQQISEMNVQLKANEKDVVDLKRNLSKLQTEVENNQKETVQEQVKQVAKIYESMSASKAAALFAVMPIEEATATLMLLDNEQQGKILGSMKDKEKAAEMTMMMKDVALLPDSNQLSLEEKINQLAEARQSPVAAISETIAKMPTAQAAVIIQTMMETNEKVAMNIMNDVSADIRSQILAVIAQDDQKLAAKITANLN